MRRTTIYLPDALKTAIEKEAVLAGISEAEFIRRALNAAVTRPRRRAGIIDGEPIANRTDESLARFGQG